MSDIQAAGPVDRDAIHAAITHLRRARSLLAQARAPRAAAAARKALRSAEGAARHVDHRLRRSQS